VDVRFGTNPLGGYEMDVHKGGCAPSYQLCTNIGGPFDWYTDQPTNDVNCSGDPPCGEGDCSPLPDVEGVNVCEDDTAIYYVAVRRVDGDASCDEYTLVVTNGVYAWQ
jgi:hypothetical protein